MLAYQHRLILQVIFALTYRCFNVILLTMKKAYRKTISALLLIPFFSVITFCCCLEKDADASVENVSIEHHQELEKSNNHSEHQHGSQSDDECSCPKHLSFLSQQPFDIAPDLSSFQFLAKNFLAVPSFEVVLLSSLSLHALGPPGQDHRDQVSIPIYLKISNFRI